MDVAVRIAVVLGVLGLAFGLVPLLERRGAVRSTALSPGVTVVVAPGCRLCGPTVDTLRRGGLRPHVIDAGSPQAAALKVRAVPTLLEVDDEGRVITRRTGRSALDEAARLARRSSA